VINLNLKTVNDLLYKENYYYIYSMSIYHVMIILASYLIGYVPAAVKYRLTLDVGQVYNFLDPVHIVSNYMLVLLAIVLDLIFLIIIKLEFNPNWLTYNRIIYIEILSLFAGFLFPYIREILFFLSINSLSMTIIYYVIKNVWLSKYLFITGSYIYILKLIIYVVQVKL